MRRLFTVKEATEHGLTRAALRWGVQVGRWRPIDRGVYLVGAEEPTPFERAAGAVLATGGVASGTLAGVLHGLDGVVLRGPMVTVAPTSSGRRPGVRRQELSPDRVTVLDGVPCTDGLLTLVDLAARLDDDTWEQALESALRRQLISAAALEAALGPLGQSRTPGAARIKRVLARRRPGAPPTESLSGDPHGPTRQVGPRGP